MAQGGGGMNPFDMFRNFGFGQREQQGPQEGPTLEAELKVRSRQLAAADAQAPGFTDGYLSRQSDGSTYLAHGTRGQCRWRGQKLPTVSLSRDRDGAATDSTWIRAASAEASEEGIHLLQTR